MITSIIDISFVVVLLFMFLDLLLVFKPKIPLLNGIMGLLSAGVILTTYSVLPLFPWMSLLMVSLTFLVSFSGLMSYMGKDLLGNKK